jgi:hypothetical protein
MIFINASLFDKVDNELIATYREVKGIKSAKFCPNSIERVIGRKPVRKRNTHTQDYGTTYTTNCQVLVGITQ